MLWGISRCSQYSNIPHKTCGTVVNPIGHTVIVTSSSCPFGALGGLSLSALQRVHTVFLFLSVYVTHCSRQTPRKGARRVGGIPGQLQSNCTVPHCRDEVRRGQQWKARTRTCHARDCQGIRLEPRTERNVVLPVVAVWHVTFLFLVLHCVRLLGVDCHEMLLGVYVRRRENKSLKMYTVYYTLSICLCVCESPFIPFTFVFQCSTIVLFTKLILFSFTTHRFGLQADQFLCSVQDDDLLHVALCSVQVEDLLLVDLCSVQVEDVLHVTL